MKRKTLRTILTTAVLTVAVLGGSTLTYAEELPVEGETEVTAEQETAETENTFGEAEVAETETAPAETTETQEPTASDMTEASEAQEIPETDMADEADAVILQETETTAESEDEEELVGASGAVINSAGIYVASQDGTGVTAGMVTDVTGSGSLEYRWLAYDIKAETWSTLSDWTLNNEWYHFNPGKYGDYLLQCEVRPVGNEGGAKSDCIGVNHHPNIKGKCQMPYTGEGGGFLIGVESYDNPNNEYSYEMLILDCTLLAQGKDAWIYTTGQCKVDGNAFWTVWQPEYGYYWTLFRVYDRDGNLIDEDCYGFKNTCFISCAGLVDGCGNPITPRAQRNMEKALQIEFLP